MTSSDGNDGHWYTNGCFVATVGIATIAATLIALVAYLYPRSSDPQASAPSPTLTSPTGPAASVQAITSPASPPPTASPTAAATAPSSDVATSNAPSAAPPAPRVQSVQVQTGDYLRVGAGLYQLSGAPTLQLRYWWTTMTNYGAIDSGDTSCTVVGTITNTSSGAVVDIERSATCTLDGWEEVHVPQGSFKLTVTVTLQSGATGSGSTLFRVIP
jgi:hypothetical protein